MADTTEEDFQLIISLINTLNGDYEKLVLKKNQTSGKKLRATLLTIKKLCDTIRKSITAKIVDIKNSRVVPVNEPVNDPVINVPVSDSNTILKILKQKKPRVKKMKMTSES